MSGTTQQGSYYIDPASGQLMQGGKMQGGYYSMGGYQGGSMQGGTVVKDPYAALFGAPKPTQEAQAPFQQNAFLTSQLANKPNASKFTGDFNAKMAKISQNSKGVSK